jgi:hypothetical protein
MNNVAIHLHTITNVQLVLFSINFTFVLHSKLNKYNSINKSVSQ